MIRKNPRAVLLFLGPQGYVSPSWLTDRTQAPTWNYASAQFVVDIEFIEDEPRMAALMRDLVGAAEAGRERAWSIDDMGPRYSRLVQAVIGFHARIRDVRAKFKLGQDERDENYAEIIKGLAGEPADELSSSGCPAATRTARRQPMINRRNCWSRSVPSHSRQSRHSGVA